MKGIKKVIRTVFGKEIRPEVPFNRDEHYSSLDNEVYAAYNKFRPAGPQKLFCYVPFNNMSFSFKGRVLACAYNQKVVLGNYPQMSIHDMWFNSEMGNKLRGHMEKNDLNYGCKHCKYFAEHYKFSGLKPLVYDKYADFKAGQFPRVMEFELSNTCNFECIMCNGEVSSSIRKNRDKLPPLKSPYNDVFVEQLKDFVPYLKEAKFYGGEPFYTPIYFKIWDLMFRLNPKIKLFVITNGSILTPQVKDVLEKGNFDIGVSMDATNKELLESIRKNVNYETLTDNINYFNNYCKRKGKKLVISFTVMRINYAEFPLMIKFCNSLDAILYVSYLKTPDRYAIWNLPAENLRAIREEMSVYQFPSNTFSAKSNKQCFDDFLTFLDNTEKENISRDIKELLPLSDSNEFHALSQPEFDPEEDYMAALQKKIDLDPRRKKLFFEKIHRSFKDLPTGPAVNKLYFSMLHSNQEELVHNVEVFSEKELSKIVKDVLKIQTKKDNLPVS